MQSVAHYGYRATYLYQILQQRSPVSAFHVLRGRVVMPVLVESNDPEGVVYLLGG